MTSSISEAALRAAARAHGFEAFGVARADAAPLAGERLRAWLADGCHGEMLWMAANADRRADPRALWPDVRSIVMLGMSYAPALDPLRHLDAPETGVISVYALGGDYHDLIKARLKALARWMLDAAGGRRREGVRRYRAGDGEAAGRGGGAGLAGQAQQSGQPRARIAGCSWARS